MTSDLRKANLLSDVVIIRNILIVLLVFYHAFAFFSGAWEPLEGFPEIKAYWWLDKLSYAFMLELFVFISGYVFGYQVRVKGEKKLRVKDLFWGKFKRLIIPSIVFSVLYIMLFGDITQPVLKTIIELLSGAGHMWFLPMLFWCFVGIWVIEKLHINHKLTLLILVILLICSFLPFPLRMNFTMYYMLFFYVGYEIQRHEIPLDWLYTKKSAILAVISFLVLFPTLTLLRENTSGLLCGYGENQHVITLVNHSVKRILQLIYASAGIVMTLSLIGFYLKKHVVADWMFQLGSLSFGVYLFQEFILRVIYYYSNAPTLIGWCWLPWIGFIVALVLSLFFSWLLRKTKVGRFLIG